MNNTRYLIDDMKKYDKDLDENMYKHMNKKELLEKFSEYYDKNLPVDLLTWSRANEPDKNLIYERGFWDQVLFIRDNINSIFYETYDEYMSNPVLVINTHVSKSVKLPVYEINVEKYGLKILLVNDFYEWSVSVISDIPLNIDVKGLFDINKKIYSVYCKGFKEENVLDSFKENKQQFTFQTSDNYKLYTLLYLINDYLKNK